MTPLDTFLACACVLLVVAFAVTVAAFKRALRSAYVKVAWEAALKDKWFAAAIRNADALVKANVRLAPFVAKRSRNSDGRFKSSKAA